eukprot:m.70785 g.70785  ORF g.70785 m.70785 type:complete len:107 (-) comp12268_c2_seq1:3591-3911(-)
MQCVCRSARLATVTALQSLCVGALSQSVIVLTVQFLQNRNANVETGCCHSRLSTTLSHPVSLLIVTDRPLTSQPAIITQATSSYVWLWCFQFALALPHLCKRPFTK